MDETDPTQTPPEQDYGGGDVVSLEKLPERLIGRYRGLQSANRVRQQERWGKGGRLKKKVAPQLRRVVFGRAKVGCRSTRESCK